MKKISLLGLFLLGLLASLTAQPFFQTYDSDSLLTSVAIATSDGGFLLEQKAQYPVNPSVSSGFFLLKTDENGNEEWKNFYTPTGGQNHLRDMVQTSDGNYVLSVSVYGIDSEEIFIIKIDGDGNILWQKYHVGITSSNGIGPFNQGSKIIEDNDGNLIVFGQGETEAALDFGQRPFLLKLDANGDLLLNQSYFVNDSSLVQANFFVYDLIQTSNEDFVVVGEVMGDLAPNPFIFRTDKNGNLLWSNPVLNGSPSLLQGVIENDNGELIVTGGTVSPGLQLQLLVYKLDASGNIIWEKYHESGEGYFWQGMDIIQTDDGGYAISGHETGYIVVPEITIHQPLFLKLDGLGNLVYQQAYLVQGLGKGLVIESDLNGGYTILGGEYENNLLGPNIYGSFILKVDGFGGLFTNNIKGNIFKDNDMDCAFSSGDENLSGWVVVAEGDHTYYGHTNINGDYTINCDTGNYTVQVHLPTPLWGTDCQPIGHQVSLPLPYVDTLDLDFPMTPTVNCSWMTVDITAPFLERCFDNNIYVNYCNQGLVDEPNTVIEVTLDPFLTYISSTIPVDNQNGNIFTFDIGNVPYGNCGQFIIVANVDCDSTELGQTHCNEAYIYPDSLCMPVDPNWDGSEVTLGATCEDSTIIFNIENIGTGDMDEELIYYVFEDHVILMQETFQLTSGGNLPITLPANGATYRVICEQAMDHPSFSKYESLSIEGCVADNGSPFSLGMVNIFNDFSEEPFYSIDCVPNVGSFDPNDKGAIPVGYGDEHFIKKTDDLEYLIRFQNTGTAVAHNVVIKDPISEHLNPATLQPVASSHDYQMRISGEGLVEFIFENIMLPDSNSNEPASHGFIKYKILQKENNPIGTLIENYADIYFDFNEPIRTNTTFHTVGENYYVTVTGTENPNESGAELTVYPNPFSSEAIFEINYSNQKEFYFKLIDITGKVMQEENVGNKFLFERGNTSSGIYFYQIHSTEGKLIHSGKVIIQ